MNQDQIKDPVSHVCLVGAVVASYSPAQQEVASSNTFTVMTIFLVTEFSE